ncbi:MAG TPA: arsenic resistance N-acetyltransferase ArsN2 [Aggregatilineaceae bacterium]|nr:arsenic resistance N-acetyltransferase ArsN2 [Aggregatilineaceae bacterium]
MNWTFRTAGPDDWTAIAALLTRVDLPLDGAREHLDGFLLAFGGATLAGVAGLERYGATGLLRSVAVAERGTGLGKELVRRLLDRASADGLTSVVLLTTTAADYFPRFGFHRIARKEAPSAVQESIEFKSACPDSAIVMELPLKS